MQDPRQGTATGNATSVTLVTTAETVIITTPLIAVPADAGNVVVIAHVIPNGGGGVTGYTLRLRRGATLADTQAFGFGPILTPGAGQPNTLTFVFSEVITAFSAVQYSLTLAQAGAVANGSTLLQGIALWFF
jgi:hypothetical protein